MTYPPAPWHLQGKAFVSLHLVSLDVSRPLIPPELTIVEILPGLSFAGVYLSSYQAGSILEYNELIVVPALVRYQNQIGFWISHIYVDREDSVRGGREIWGLPKEMAHFKWTETAVLVTQQDRSLCHFSLNSGWPDLSSQWLPKLQGNCLSQLNGHLLSFEGQFKAGTSLFAGKLDIPPDSPFFSMNLGRGFLAVGLNNLDLTVTAPRQVTNLSIP